MHAHRLGREIAVATQVVNNMLHGGGTAFAFRLHEETGAPASEIARAYAIAREVFGMRPSGLPSGARQRGGADPARGCCSRAGASSSEAHAGSSVTEPRRWTSRRRSPPSSRSVGALRRVPGLLDADDLEPIARRVDELRSAGVPDGLAEAASRRCPHPLRGLRRGRVSEEAGSRSRRWRRSISGWARFSGYWLRDRVVDLGRDDRWKARARSALRDDLCDPPRADRQGAPRARRSRSPSPRERVDAWVEDQQAAGRCLQTVADVRAGRVYDLTTLSVAVREVRSLLG